MYFNVTHSGVQGEKYLLNQQLSSVQLLADLRLTEKTKIHSLLVYNPDPTPINPRVYLDEVFLETKVELSLDLNNRITCSSNIANTFALQLAFNF